MSLVARGGRADELSVPINLQVDLLGRVVRFERKYASQGSVPALVILVTKQGVAASVRAAAQASAAIGQMKNLGGRQATAAIQTFTSAAALRTAAREAAVLYLMPGFSPADLEAIAAAFVDSNVLTVGASDGDADHGATVGFELSSSKPRIVVNLPQARAQRLDFSAQFLRIARVVP